ncbi:hypothetical protein [Leptolyngbya sp. FACHB-261]|uniref:hypothetical protein n=1 Tax=Leptolyngbya sp. FACHB-261 TaxID=2692806 RepID=UPI0016894668|nr:hypothetical protein [Leptolyngbya sp. FACHB-261]MBD2101248.1 hypothetical protein [Leptolyngbya sp. FACHB-261]
MPYQTSFKSNPESIELSSSSQSLSTYQLAILSALYEPKDLPKVRLLAHEWGYSQEKLCSIWQKLHA